MSDKTPNVTCNFQATNFVHCFGAAESKIIDNRDSLEFLADCLHGGQHQTRFKAHCAVLARNGGKLEYGKAREQAGSLFPYTKPVSDLRLHFRDCRPGGKTDVAEYINYPQKGGEGTAHINSGIVDFVSGEPLQKIINHLRGEAAAALVLRERIEKNGKKTPEITEAGIKEMAQEITGAIREKIDQLPAPEESITTADLQQYLYDMQSLGLLAGNPHGVALLLAFIQQRKMQFSQIFSLLFTPKNKSPQPQTIRSAVQGALAAEKRKELSGLLAKKAGVKNRDDLLEIKDEDKDNNDQRTAEINTAVLCEILAHKAKVALALAGKLEKIKAGEAAPEECNRPDDEVDFDKERNPVSICFAPEKESLRTWQRVADRLFCTDESHRARIRLLAVVYAGGVLKAEDIDAKLQSLYFNKKRKRIYELRTTERCKPDRNTDGDTFVHVPKKVNGKEGVKPAVFVAGEKDRKRLVRQFNEEARMLSAMLKTAEEEPGCGWEKLLKNSLEETGPAEKPGADEKPEPAETKEYLNWARACDPLFSSSRMVAVMFLLLSAPGKRMTITEVFEYMRKKEFCIAFGFSYEKHFKVAVTETKIKTAVAEHKKLCSRGKLNLSVCVSIDGDELCLHEDAFKKMASTRIAAARKAAAAIAGCKRYEEGGSGVEAGSNGKTKPEEQRARPKEKSTNWKHSPEFDLKAAQRVNRRTTQLLRKARQKMQRELALERQQNGGSSNGRTVVKRKTKNHGFVTAGVLETNEDLNEIEAVLPEDSDFDPDGAEDNDYDTEL